jgi:hypothetical protein
MSARDPLATTGTGAMLVATGRLRMARSRSVGRGGRAYWRARDPARRDEGAD